MFVSKITQKLHADLTEILKGQLRGD